MSQKLPETFRQPTMNEVAITSGFWRKKMDVNRENTLPIEHELCLSTGRIDALKMNWRQGQPNQPHIFWDSDVAKWIEAAAYSLHHFPDKALEQKIDHVADLIEKAQMPDGYLNSHFQTAGIEGRWKNLRDNHELYCAGHLIEGAVAYYQATGKTKLLECMKKFADHIAATFGNAKGKKRGYCGHEEIELALVKLYRVTGEKKYLELAKYFVDERGKTPHYYDIEAKKRGEDPEKFWAETYEYCQAHIPVRKQTTIVGHAVRAMYLYCAMADIASETNDKSLLDACKNIWHDLVTKKMHITGGIGPACANEGFTTDYDMPNEGAYLETCAAIGLFLWAYRMFNADPSSEYTDIMELALHNGILSGVSPDGKKFFYGNPLAAQPGFDGNGKFQDEKFHYQRSEWFDCACCPPNIARLLASLPTFICSCSESSVFLHLYSDSKAEFKLNSGNLRISQKSKMPWEGKAQIKISSETKIKFNLNLRIPSWCRKLSIKINGKTANFAKSKSAKGYAEISRIWENGDKVAISMEMPTLQIEASPDARQNCGRIAVQRGPFIYCLEEADNGKNLNDIQILRNSQMKTKKIKDKTLGEIVAISAKATKRQKKEWNNKLYKAGRSKSRKLELKAIPYALWGNRKPGEMITWIRTD